MADQVQRRGGTEAENNAFTGADRELSVDTTNKGLRVHDGAKAGGFAQISETQYIPVADYSALQGLTAGDHTLAYVQGRSSAGDGGQGLFVWRSGDQSANVQANTDEVVWVPPSSDTTGASGAWERLTTGPLNVQWGGVAADGAADDSSAFVAIQEELTDRSGGRVEVPFASAGYQVGDGSTNTTAIVPTNKTQWHGIGEVKLVHQAKTSNGNNYLFLLEDVEDVVVDGFEIDAGSATRVGVTLSGTIDNVTIRNLYIHDCDNYGLQYADTDTTAASAYYNNVRLENIRIDGVVGAIGGGSGINFFPRAGDAVSSGLTMVGLDIDVSEGSTADADHGPQAIKLSNAENVQMSHTRLRGGQVGALVLTTGVRDVQIESLHTSRCSRGIVIDSSISSAAPAATVARRIEVGNFVYRVDGLTGGDEIGIDINGDPQDVKFNNFDIEGDIRLRANDTADELKNLHFGTGVIRGGGFYGDDDGNTPTNDIKGVHIGSLHVMDSDRNTAVEFGETDWPISESYVNKLYMSSFPLQGIRVHGDDNHFGEIHAEDGNTGGSSAGTAVRDEGNRNIYDLIALTGAGHDAKFFIRKTAGSGLTVRKLRGTPVNDQAFDFQNQENSDVPQGDVIVTSQNFDLSGASTVEQLYLADVDTYILGIKFFYTEGSSADAGTDQNIRVNKSSILTYTSESSKAQFASTKYINTSGTRSFTTRKISKGDYLDISFGGGKTGAGELLVQVSMVRADG